MAVQGNQIRIGETEVKPGSQASIALPVAKLYTREEVAMPVQVINGKRPGPRLFVSAAIHGDELNGVEIIRRLLRLPALKNLQGTLIAIPIVNVHGLVNRSRYLPDRRDLNRSFPGSEKSSLAGRMANLFLNEVVAKCTHGIDLHTGALHRSNLPQIRANLDDAQTLELAQAFGTPILLNANLRDGSLRQAAAECGIPMLLYEAGEALRFDEFSIRAGVQGILNVMRHLGMLTKGRSHRPPAEPRIAQGSTWVRAPESGILRVLVPLGREVHKGDVLAMVSCPYGNEEHEVRAHKSGVIIGRSHLPLVHEGEALFNIALFNGDRPEDASESVSDFQQQLQTAPLFEEEIFT
ncbi:succinylglutamate desuccinylase/aspartoacylase family protein [Balneatrix alpica]|uniref:Succinylglutamate desuccinylase/aspartoacylase family protein n=1 Tax=Balneatrix alpica TaxID=75684 RepID=A0ABV5Z7H2_9GAMM|nr:succinylglutamate desuccinylase/aspartoacylase family protein [Balneatrix alpica]